MQTTVFRSILAVVITIGVSELLANNPPNKGKFPAGFWSILRDNPELVKYGDPGWMKRMERRRHLRQEISLGKQTNASLNNDTFTLPVLLGEYSDNAGTFTAQNFQDLLFDNNSDGTMTEYFNEISYNQFTVTGTAFGWYTADESMSFYASTNNGLGGTFPQNRNGFVVNIVQKADADVDFSQFDNDGPDGTPNSGDDDGYVDGVMIVYAGAGADWFPSNNNLWPSMSSLGSNEVTTNDAAAGGGMIKVSTFAVCPERAGGGAGVNQIRPIGVFAHEFGHILGLPDLYDRTNASQGPDFEDSEGIGEWCLMAYGSWGGDGAHTETPAHMSAWCKIQMGWLTPTVLTENVTGLAVQQAATNPEAYLAWEDGYESSRYFLIENRQKVGFDRFLNGHGLLIFHVDENRRWGRISFSLGPVNDDETHKFVDLEEADGDADLDNNNNRGDSGDTFPGSSNNRSFTNATSPNSQDVNGVETGFAITNISGSGATMTMDVVVRETFGYGLAYDENGVTGWGWGFSNPQDIWGGVRFTAAEAGTLDAVDVGFRSSPTTYQILIYDSFSAGSPSGLQATVNGSAATHGWFTIPLSEPGVPVETNQEFFVALKIEDQSFALSYDRWGENSGRSWTSGDGTVYSNSIGTAATGGDLNIRARIRAADVATSVSLPEDLVPQTFTLRQNYPNPFNPSTVIEFSIPSNQFATLKVYNMKGAEVATLFAQKFEAGPHKFEWTPTSLASGVYFYRLQAGEFRQSKKLVLLK
ncbi:M6 family metalloprotease domain-containing protein [bacterium]|nr:M6 family metalloprotease domain-containing protein [bacterium]